jgi:predicted nucleic acid-binding protein
MAGHVIVDSGPIVALIDRRDSHHEWASNRLDHLHEPLRTCEAVLSEAFFLLGSLRHGTTTLCGLLSEELILVEPAFSLAAHSTEILNCLERYRNVPMSFADACLVKMSEIDRRARIFTTDRDFLSSRRNRRELIR